MGAIPVGQAVFQKVIAKLGGVYPAAVQLGVEPSLIRRFLDGTTPVSDAMLLRGVDIVLDESRQDPAGSSQPFDRGQR